MSDLRAIAIAGGCTRYRPDIDGIRAVAVLGVVAFHVDLLSGGYVGVDIFFVISGFLITQILADELSKGEFGFASLKQFFERRIRRIMPALVAVCATTYAMALAFLLPDDLKEFGRSLQGVALFASNYYFIRKTGYFDGSADEKPLLHTWSLAVEEQYYLLFPLALWVFWRLGGRRAAIFACIIVAAMSLAYSEYRLQSNATTAFFPHRRAFGKFLSERCLRSRENICLPRGEAAK